MSAINPKELGQQLRKPSDELGRIVGVNMNTSNVAIYALAFSMIEFNDNANILEIGFGNGRFFSNYFNINSDVNVFGIDHSDIMCHEAILLNRKYIDNEQLILRCEDSIRTSFDNDYFDTIVSINTIYFWEHTDKQIQEICRILKKGGKLIIGYSPKNQMERFQYAKEGFRLFEFLEIIDIFKKHGLQIVEQKRKKNSKKSVDGQYIESIDVCITFENCKKEVLYLNNILSLTN